MDDFITKPVLEENIETILKKWLLQGRKDHAAATEIVKPVHFDSRKLESYLDNDLIRIKKIIGITVNQLNQILVQVDEMIVQLDPEIMISLSHKVYGMASSAGLNNLAAISSGMQEPDISDHVALKAKVELLKQEIEILIPLLKKRYAVD